MCRLMFFPAIAQSEPFLPTAQTHSEEPMMLNVKKLMAGTSQTPPR
jgi:hypothetical protein